MSQFVLEVVLDGDTCSVLDKTEYSTNPRKFITIENMVEYNRLRERVEKEVRGA